MRQAVTLSLATCLTLPNPAFALRQAGLEENAAKQEFLNRLDANAGVVTARTGMEESAGWIAEDVWNAFASYNLGKPPRIIQAHGDRSAVLGQVEKELRKIPGAEPVPGIPLLTHEPFVALALQVDSPNRTDHILVIDRVGRIHQRLEDISAGRIKLEEYEFVLHLSVHPTHNAIYLHTVSLGRELESALRGKGLVSATFQRLVGKLRHDYPTMNISTVAASAIVERWFGKYFGAHFASEVEYSEVNRYVHVPPSDAPSLLIGQIIPPSGGSSTSDTSPVAGSQRSTHEGEIRSLIQALENGDPKTLETLRSWLEGDRTHPGIFLDYLVRDDQMRQILHLLTRLAATSENPVLRNESLSLFSEFSKYGEAQRLLPEEAWRSIQAWREGPTPDNVPLVFGALGGPDRAWDEDDAYAFGAAAATLQSWVRDGSSRRALITTMHQHPGVIDPATTALLRLMNALILHPIAHTLYGMGLREAAENTLLEFDRYVEFDPLLAPAKESIERYARQWWRSPQEARESVDLKALFDQLLKPRPQDAQAAPPPAGIGPPTIMMQPGPASQKRSWLRYATLFLTGALLTGIAGKLTYDTLTQPTQVSVSPQSPAQVVPEQKGVPVPVPVPKTPVPAQKGGQSIPQKQQEAPKPIRPAERATFTEDDRFIVPIPQSLSEQLSGLPQNKHLWVRSYVQEGNVYKGVDAKKMPADSRVINFYGASSYKSSSDRIVAVYWNRGSFGPFADSKEIPGSLLLRVNQDGTMEILRDQLPAFIPNPELSEETLTWELPSGLAKVVAGKYAVAYLSRQNPDGSYSWHRQSPRLVEIPKDGRLRFTLSHDYIPGSKTNPIWSTSGGRGVVVFDKRQDAERAGNPSQLSPSALPGARFLLRMATNGAVDYSFVRVWPGIPSIENQGPKAHGPEILDEVLPGAEFEVSPKSGLEESILIPQARVLQATENVPVKVRLEIGEHAFADGLTEETARRILATVSRQDSSGVIEAGRSLYLLLPSQQPWIVQGQPLDTFKMKQTTYRGSPPVAEAYGPSDEETIQQPTSRLVFRNGKMFMEPVPSHPKGGGYLDEAVNEYTLMLQAFRNGVPTGYPIGVGQFLDLKFQDRPLGFVVMAIHRTGEGQQMDLRIQREVLDRREAGEAEISQTAADPRAIARARGPLYQDLFHYFANSMMDAMTTLRLLHEAGITHTHPHPDQFRRTEGNVPPPIYDFTNAGSVEIMSREEFIFRVFNDYRAAFLGTYMILPGNPSVEEHRAIVAALKMDGSPPEFLYQGYFPLDQLKSGTFGNVNQIHAAASVESMVPFLNTVWVPRRFQNGVTWDEIRQQSELARIIERYAGPLYDRLIQQRQGEITKPPDTTAGMEENKAKTVEDLAAELNTRRGFGFINPQDQREWPVNEMSSRLIASVAGEVLDEGLIPKFNVPMGAEKISLQAIEEIRLSLRNSNAVISVAIYQASQVPQVIGASQRRNLIISAPADVIGYIVQRVGEVGASDRVLVIAKVKNWQEVIAADRVGAQGIEVEPAAGPGVNIEETTALLEKVASDKTLRHIRVWGSAGGVRKENVAELLGKGKNYVGFSVGLSTSGPRLRWFKDSIPTTAGLEEQQVRELKAAVQRDVAKIVDRLSTRLQSNVLLGLGPSGLESHGPEALYFVERLKEQVPAMIPFLVVIGKGAATYKYYPSVLVAAENPERAAASLRLLGAGTVQYLADNTEASALSQALQGTPITIAQRPVETLSLILQKILSALAGLDPGISQAEVEAFYGINLNELADHLKELSRIGV